MTTPNEAARLELEYWKLMLVDVVAISDAVEKAASSTMDVPLALVEAMMAPNGERGGKLLQASAASRETMNALASIGPALHRMLDLVDGRVKAIEASL